MTKTFKDLKVGDKVEVVSSSGDKALPGEVVAVINHDKSDYPIIVKHPSFNRSSDPNDQYHPFNLDGKSGLAKYAAFPATIRLPKVYAYAVIYSDYITDWFMNADNVDYCINTMRREPTVAFLRAAIIDGTDSIDPNTIEMTKNKADFDV
jgi:hypothetical protein